MNKPLLTLISFLFIFSSYSQNAGFKNGQKIARNHEDIAKQNTSTTFTKARRPASHLKTTAVTASRFTGSMNIFTVLLSESKPLQYCPNVNAVSFIHRKSSTYTASSNSNSGTIVGMYSTNTGTT